MRAALTLRAATRFLKAAACGRSTLKKDGRGRHTTMSRGSFMTLMVALLVYSSEAAPLFSEDTDGMKQGAEKSNTLIEHLSRQPGFKSTTKVRLNRNELKQVGTSIKLGKDREVNVRFDQEARRTEGSDRRTKEIWSGKIEGLPLSDVTLFVRDEYIRGKIAVNRDFYVIEYLGNGVHVFVHYDLTDVPMEF